MAGSIVTTVTQRGAGVTEYSVAFTADASGDVSLQAIAQPGLYGKVGACRYIPGTAATGTDIYLYDRDDANKIDLLGGSGANVGLSAKGVTPLLGGAYVEADVMGGLWIVVDEAGASGTGTLIIPVHDHRAR